MKVVAIVQARMGSSRLPGKIMKCVLGKPLLEYQIERLKRCKYLNEIVIATTTKKLDDTIVDFCRKWNIQYYRGSESDVLARYYEAAKIYEADVVVRITSDCPVIDPNVVDKVVSAYIDNPIYDYISNTLERSYPRGMDTSLVPFSTLEEAYSIALDELDREHVTRYIYKRPEKYKLFNISNINNESHHRWTVDTIEDFKLIKNIIENLYPINKHFSMKDILNLLIENEDWLKINEHIEQKKV